MASTLAAQTVSVSVKVTHSLPDGTSRSWEAITSFANMKYQDRRTMQIPSSAQISILQGAAPGTAIGPGKLINTKVNTLIVRNMDDTIAIRIGLKKTGAETFWIQIPAGTTQLISALDYDVDAAGGAFGAYVYPDDIVAQAESGDVDIEYFVLQET